LGVASESVEEVEAGESFDVIDGCGEVGDGLAEMGGVGQDDGEHHFSAPLDGKDCFVEVGGDADPAGANGGGLFRCEECSGDDVEGIRGGGARAHGVFELTPAAHVERGILRGGVGEDEGLRGVGKIAGRDEMAAVEAAVGVIGVGGSGGLEGGGCSSCAGVSS
jgi:hypothetical protein